MEDDWGCFSASQAELVSVVSRIRAIRLAPSRELVLADCGLTGGDTEAEGVSRVSLRPRSTLAASSASLSFTDPPGASDPPDAVGFRTDSS